MRARIVRVTLGPQGLIAVLTSGPKLRFGDGSRLEAKWIAATRVLHDPAARDAAYIDLRIPERPAAGGLSVEQGGTQVEQPDPVATAAASVDPATAATTDPAAAAVPAGTSQPGDATTDTGTAAPAAQGTAPAQGTSAPQAGGVVAAPTG
jgi:hypothetical protein